MERLNFILLALFFSLPILSSVRPVRKNIISLNSEIRMKRKIISELTKELNSFEKNLGKKNRKYIRVVEKRKNLEERSFLLKKSITSQAADTKNEIHEIKSLLGKMVISKMEKEDEPSDLLARKILKEGFKKKLIELQGSFEQIQALQNEVDSLTTRLKEYSQLELQLASLINLMEKKKNSKVHAYLKQREAYGRLSQKVDSQKKKKSLKNINSSKLQRELGVFSSPLKKHEKLEYGKKGVTYVYRKRQPVLATRKGKVIHSGTLSTFGHVVMIDHGQETRSILLGPFETKVKKGMLVREGDVLGYTIGQPHGSGKFYFEVRKKNKVQNTIYLLNTKLIAEGRSSQESS